MLRTTLILIASVIALPLLAIYYDQPLSAEQGHALRLLVKIMLSTAAVCFAVSELTGNYSQVDKIWSLMPPVYAWVAACTFDWAPRNVLMAVLASLWGLRLTYNFGRRGGYHWIPWRGEEDYRWGVLRQQNPALQKRLNWSLFNLFFISLYQNALILLFSTPVIFAWQQGSDGGLKWLDGLAALLFTGFVAVETIADQQQYNFQQEKYRRLADGESLDGDYARGFRSSGLWRLARHPNYAAEQAIWISFYLFGVAATGRWLNWSIAGPILLMLLFLNSSDFSEKITAEKYPGYVDYQRRVPRFVPRFW